MENAKGSGKTSKRGGERREEEGRRGGEEYMREVYAIYAICRIHAICVKWPNLSPLPSNHPSLQPRFRGNHLRLDGLEDNTLFALRSLN